MPSVLWRCWLGGRKGIRPVKRSEMQTCIWPSWCHCHSLSLASVKSRLVLPFWYRLTWVVPEKGPLNVCVCVCVLHNYFLAFHLHFSYHSTCHNPNPNHYLIQPKFSQLFCRQQSKFQEKSTYNLLLVLFRSKQKITSKTWPYQLAVELIYLELASNVLFKNYSLIKNKAIIHTRIQPPPTSLNNVRSSWPVQSIILTQVCLPANQTCTYIA